MTNGNFWGLNGKYFGVEGRFFVFKSNENQEDAKEGIKICEISNIGTNGKLITPDNIMEFLDKMSLYCKIKGLLGVSGERVKEGTVQASLKPVTEEIIGEPNVFANPTLVPAVEEIIGEPNVFANPTSEPAVEEKSVLEDSWEKMHIPNVPSSLLKDYSDKELSAKMDYSKFNWGLYGNGNFRYITFEDENGNPIKIEQYENGQVRYKTIEYTDEKGNKKTVGMSFDENGKLTRVYEKLADGTTISTSYDEEGNICEQWTEIPNANGDGGYTRIINEYRPDGTCAKSERSKMDQRHNTLESYSIDYNRTNGFGPDGNGRRVHHRYGDYTKYEYDEQGRCIGKQIGSRRYEYYEDENGNEYDGHYVEDVQIHETWETVYDGNYGYTITKRDAEGRVIYTETRECWPNSYDYKLICETWYDEDGNIEHTREMRWDENNKFLGYTYNKYDKEGNIIETTFEKE